MNQAATELMKTTTPARIDSWTRSTPMDWANESFAIAEQAQTQYCIRQGAFCDQPAGKVTIDAAYVVASAPISASNCRKPVSSSRICSMPLWARSVLLRRGAPCFGGDVSRGQTLWLSIRSDL